MFGIRPANGADEHAIRKVLLTAFPSPLESRLVDLLRNAGRLTCSLVATVDSRVVGYIALSPVSVAHCTDGLGLAPVAVLPDFQRQGLGAALVRGALAACRASHCKFVVVLGDPAWYRQFGFVPARMWNLRDEYGGGEAFQALELVAQGIPAGGGLVQYAPEFSLFANEP